MAAREGVGAALTRRLHILLETSGHISLTRRFRERDLTWINRKRVTSVEVNSNRDVAKERSVLGLYGQASRLISIS